jgi:hypothetical protein
MEIPTKKKNCRTYPDTRSSTRPTESPGAPPRLLYSRKEVSYQLSLSLRAIAYMIASGNLRTKRHGGRVMVTHAELLRQAALDDRDPIVPKNNRQSAPIAIMPSSKVA